MVSKPKEVGTVAACPSPCPCVGRTGLKAEARGRGVTVRAKETGLVLGPGLLARGRGLLVSTRSWPLPARPVTAAKALAGTRGETVMGRVEANCGTVTGLLEDSCGTVMGLGNGRSSESSDSSGMSGRG